VWLVFAPAAVENPDDAAAWSNGEWEEPGICQPQLAGYDWGTNNSGGLRSVGRSCSHKRHKHMSSFVNTIIKEVTAVVLT
jgi:hypothetical protein